MEWNAEGESSVHLQYRFEQLASGTIEIGSVSRVPHVPEALCSEIQALDLSCSQQRREGLQLLSCTLLDHDEC